MVSLHTQGIKYGLAVLTSAEDTRGTKRSAVCQPTVCSSDIRAFRRNFVLGGEPRALPSPAGYPQVHPHPSADPLQRQAFFRAVGPRRAQWKLVFDRCERIVRSAISRRQLQSESWTIVPPPPSEAIAPAIPVKVPAQHDNARLRGVLVETAQVRKARADRAAPSATM